MRFFSKIAVICNICFIAAMVLRYVEGSKSPGREDVLTPLPLYQNVLVILGYGAIIINILFFMAAIITFFANKGKSVPKWIYIFNAVIFLYQILFFFTNLIP